MMITLRCPVCGAALFAQEKGWRCKHGHSFDNAKEGYCNLIPGGAFHKVPGDNKEMAAARNRFFAGDPYRVLRQELCAIAHASLPDGGSLVDAGCGEGYYTSSLMHTLTEEGKGADVLGFDLSKFALRFAAKRKSGARFFAGSLFSLPLFDESADMVVSVFAPIAQTECLRVLRPGGFLVLAVPEKRHLFTLKLILSRGFVQISWKIKKQGHDLILK